MGEYGFVRKQCKSRSDYIRLHFWSTLCVRIGNLSKDRKTTSCKWTVPNTNLRYLASKGLRAIFGDEAVECIDIEIIYLAVPVLRKFQDESKTLLQYYKLIISEFCSDLQTL